MDMCAPVLRQTEVTENQILFHELYGPRRVNTLGAYIGTFSGIVAAEYAVAARNEISARVTGIIP
jgi:hypothetical protein